MDEATLYNLHNSSSSASREARNARSFFTRQIARHLIVEHGVTFGQTAKRLGLKRKELSEILAEDDSC